MRAAAASLPARDFVALATIAVLGGCDANPAGDGSFNPLLEPPVDSASVGSVAEASTWDYQREVSADLDGDGSAERVVLAADVVLAASGLPLWEDGHRWALFVVPASGAPTLLYAAFVPNGFAEVAILQANSDGRRKVLVNERTPRQVRALEIEYAGPGEARSASVAYYQVEQWLPGSASLP